MKLKLDENLNERGIALLVAGGHDVSTVVQQHMQAAVDTDVIEACRKDIEFAYSSNLNNPQFARKWILLESLKQSTDCRKQIVCGSILGQSQHRDARIMTRAEVNRICEIQIQG